MSRPPAFIGRTAELERLGGFVSAARAGRGGLLVVVGEAGVGKTRLVDELIAEVGDSATVVRGRADEHDPTAFGLWIGPMRQLDLPRPGVDPSVPTTELRWEVVDLLGSALAAAAPALLVLDDLHWADNDALWVLEQLLDGPADRVPAVVAATRGAADVRAVRWHGLYRRADVMALDGLDAGEVRQLAEHLGTRVADGRALWERTGGNPLFVREQLLAGTGSVSASVDELLTIAVERLGAEVADAVSLAALAGPATPLHVLAAAADTTTEELDRRLDVARRNDVVHDAAGGICFRHDLLAEAAIRRLDAEQRQRTHLALADAWQPMTGATATSHRARHQVQAVPLLDASDATAAALHAAEELRCLGQHAEAAALLHGAAVRLGSRGDVSDETRARLHLAEGEARWALQDHDGALAACESALAAADRAGIPSLVAAAEVASLTHHNPFLPDPLRLAKLGELDAQLAADATVDPVLRIRLRGRQAVMSMALPERLDGAMVAGDDAVRLARQLGDPAVLVQALADRYFVLPTPADCDAKLEAAAEILSLARATGRPELALMGHEWTYAGRMAQGDMTGAIAALDSLELLSAIMPSPYWRYASAIRRSGLLAMLGDYEGALALAASSRALAAGVVPDNEAVGLDAGIRLSAAMLYGRTDHGARNAHDELVAMLGSLPVLFFQARFALGEAMLGDPIAARIRLMPWLGRFHTALHTPEGLPTLSVIAHTAIIIGWAEAAPALRAVLQPFVGRLPAGNGGVADVSVDHVLAALALLAGDTAAAARHAPRALDLARSLRSPVLEARALALLAETAARSGDDAAAASARDAAESLAEPLGMQLHPPWGTRAAGRSAARPQRPAGNAAVTLELQHGRWSIESPFGSANVAASIGMDQIVRLVGARGAEVPAVELANTGSRRAGVVASDLGPALDARAKREYRQRINELQADIDDADADHDVERAAGHRLEMEAILDQLRAAVGLGGRDRPQGSGSERARVNAARTVRRGIAAIKAALPELGAHLEVSIRTGHHCSYSPEPAAALEWHILR